MLVTMILCLEDSQRGCNDGFSFLFVMSNECMCVWFCLGVPLLTDTVCVGVLLTDYMCVFSAVYLLSIECVSA